MYFIVMRDNFLFRPFLDRVCLSIYFSLEFKVSTSIIFYSIIFYEKIFRYNIKINQQKPMLNYWEKCFKLQINYSGC